MAKKIIGVTVGTTSPRPNWSQTNTRKSDFIKNKPEQDLPPVTAADNKKVLQVEEGKWKAKQIADANALVLEHNQAETAHPAIRSAITEVSNEVKNLDVDGKIERNITAHNTNQEAHNDIRLALIELADRVNHALDSDDVDLDQLIEIVGYIKQNRDVLEGVTTNKVNYTDIVDNLDTSMDKKALSAKQGVILKALIEEVRAQIRTEINSHDINAASHHGLREMVEDVGDRVTVLEKAKPNLEGYVTTEQLETVLGTYITDIDAIVGGGIEGGESGGETPTIKGVWLFNESIFGGGEGAGTYTVNFTSYAFPFTTIDLLYEGFGYTISYDDTAVMTGASGADSGYWNIEQYRTVDFGDTEQAVPEAFLAFMQAHATQISESGGSTG